MDKSTTTLMKGIAILMMLYLHLFNKLPNLENCVDILHINGLPLANIISRCTHPVAFYLILSGYGLYKSKNLTYKQNAKRTFKLYIHYWIVLIIFALCIGPLFNPSKYPGDIFDIINNITAWDTTSYNYEIWFLFPYLVVMFLSPTLFKLFNKSTIYTIIVSGIGYLISYFLIWKYGIAYIYSHQFAETPINIISFCFPFYIGAFLAKYQIIEKTSKYFKTRQLYLFLIIITISCIRMTTSFDAIHIIYVSILIPLLASINYSKAISTCLAYLGKHSTSMWFVHTYFCYYLFHDFIYGFKYPIVIFIVLIAISLITAIFINIIRDYIYKLIKV